LNATLQSRPLLLAGRLRKVNFNDRFSSFYIAKRGRRLAKNVAQSLTYGFLAFFQHGQGNLPKRCPSFDRARHSESRGGLNSPCKAACWALSNCLIPPLPTASKLSK